jgi:UDP-glucose 4-epimerase
LSQSNAVSHAEARRHAYDPAVRVIVTGGAGFIGSHVADACLARGDDVVVLDNLASGRRENVDAGAELVEADIRDSGEVESLFGRFRPELCFHFAAQADVRVSVARPDFDCEVNVLGTIRVLEAATRRDTQIVFASTGGAIYGECDRPATEESKRLPLAPYGASKLAAEEYLATFNRLYDQGHVALRLGNVFGPRQDPHGEAGVVAIFLGLLARGGSPTIFGDGRQTRDYVFVADVARASLAAPGGRGGVFNVGTGRETSVLELHAACCRVAGVDAPPVFAPARSGELTRSVLDPSSAARELGVRADTPLEDGLRATWEWIREKEPRGR